MVEREWIPFNPDLEIPASIQFADSLLALNKKVAEWSMIKMQTRDKSLKDAEEAIANVFRSNAFGVFYEDELSALANLETSKASLLKVGEVN